MLIGREQELAHLSALVEAARHGSAGSVVVRGEPGVGKSALLDELVNASHQATVLRTRGLEAEAPLAFAALHRLLRPVMRLRGALPPPQARALRVAFGEEDGPSVEPFLVGVATLTVLTAAAEENLVVCVIDDAHWLDPASAGALLFCASRLGADRVVMLFATRDDAATPFQAPGVGELVLTGLGPDAARALLERHLRTHPLEDVTRRLIAETGGNPLALLELPTELTAAQLHGAVATAGPAPPHHARGTGLPRPQSEALRRRTDGAPARSRRRHRRGRGAQTCSEVPRSGRGRPGERSGVGAAGRGRADRRGTTSARAVGDLPGRHGRGSTTRPSSAG